MIVVWDTIRCDRNLLHLPFTRKVAFSAKYFHTPLHLCRKNWIGSIITYRGLSWKIWAKISGADKWLCKLATADKVSLENLRLVKHIEAGSLILSVRTCVCVICRTFPPPCPALKFIRIFYRQFSILRKFNWNKICSGSCALENISNLFSILFHHCQPGPLGT